MIKNWKAIVLSAMIVIASVPVAAVIPAPAVFAAAPTISLNKTTVSRGDSVAVSGYFEPNSWVSLRVIDSQSNVVVFDAVKSDTNGQYSFILIAPSAATTGTLNVYAGAGEQVASATLQLTSSGSGSPNPNPDTETPPNGEDQSPAVETTPSSIQDGLVIFKPQPTSSTDGRAIAAVAVEGSTISQALENGGEKLSISIDAVSAPIVTVGLTNEALKKLQQSVSTNELEIVSLHGTYVISTQLLQLEALAASHGVAADQIAIKIAISQATSAQKLTIDQASQAQGARSVSEAIDFSVEVTLPGGKSTLLDLGNTYVSRSITLPAAVADLSKLTGVRYDPVTGKLAFVPTVFQEQDGQIVATLKRNGNSLYTIIEHTKTFDDIAASHWGKADIELLASKLVVNGLSENKFGPNETVTRAEFASMIVRALGLEQAGTASFSDVRGTEWFAGAIGAAYEAGLISGYTDGTFRPNEQITRQELAMLISNALAFTDNQLTVDTNVQLGKFTDRSVIASWAQTAIAQITAAGITEGRSNDQFVPAASSTRAEAVTMIKRLLQHIDFIN